MDQKRAKTLFNSLEEKIKEFDISKFTDILKHYPDFKELDDITQLLSNCGIRTYLSEYNITKTSYVYNRKFYLCDEKDYDHEYCLDIEFYEKRFRINLFHSDTYNTFYELYIYKKTDKAQFEIKHTNKIHELKNNTYLQNKILSTAISNLEKTL
jgi:hypothetical protein